MGCGAVSKSSRVSIEPRAKNGVEGGRINSAYATYWRDMAFQLLDTERSGCIDADQYALTKTAMSAAMPSEAWERVRHPGSGGICRDEWNAWTREMFEVLGEEAFVEVCEKTMREMRKHSQDEAIRTQLHPWLDLDFSKLEEGFRSHGAARPQKIELTEHRAITVRQLKQLEEFVLAFGDQEGKLRGWWNRAFGLPCYGQAIGKADINLYTLCDWVIFPATAKYQCSYVELVVPRGTTEQRPTWFVSHWWGEPVVDFIAILSQHSVERGLTEDAPYWVCAYANNQHLLGNDLSSDPAESSFRKAIGLSVGTVSVMDKSRVTYTRIWCAYEVYTSIDPFGFTQGTYLYDVYTIVDDVARKVVGLTDGPIEEDNAEGPSYVSELKLRREQQFPLDVLEGAMKTHLQKAQASQETDRRRILNTIALHGDLEAVPPDEHSNYQDLNNTLASYFAVAGWTRLLAAGYDMEACGSKLRASSLKKIDISFALAQASDLKLDALFLSLPESLQTLYLDLCLNVEPGRLLSLFTNLPTALRHLRLYMNGVPFLDDDIRVLGQGLPTGLVECQLGLAYCTEITDAGLVALATHTPPSVRWLNLDCWGQGKVTNEGFCSFVNALPASIQTLDLRFVGTEIGDEGLDALIAGLPAGLSDFDAMLPEGKCTEEGVSRLKRALTEKGVTIHCLDLASP